MKKINRKLNLIFFYLLFSTAATADDVAFLEFIPYEALALILIEEQWLTASITLLVLYLF
jgi:hypothetical protein